MNFAVRNRTENNATFASSKFFTDARQLIFRENLESGSDFAQEKGRVRGRVVLWIQDALPSPHPPPPSTSPPTVAIALCPLLGHEFRTRIATSTSPVSCQPRLQQWRWL
jgi:hypothetical protein